MERGLVLLLVVFGVIFSVPAWAEQTEQAPGQMTEQGSPQDEYVALPTRPGVILPVALVVPQAPTASVILLAGNNGVLDMENSGGRAVIHKAGNFLVRTRALYVARGIATAVPEPPSDQTYGMTPGFRFSDAQVDDLRALVKYMRERTGTRPWLVGTSMGTLSAAWAAAHLDGNIGGLVLTSSVTHTAKRWGNAFRTSRGVLDAGLKNVTVPTLVVAHHADNCSVTPPEDANRILELLERSPHKELLFFEGGLPSQSDACQAKSAHGYFGIEERVVDAIAGFILKQNECLCGPCLRRCHPLL